MSVHDRLARTLERLATGTNVQRAREYDRQRAARNGVATPEERLEAVVVKLELVADDIWRGLEGQEATPELRRAA